MGVELFHTDRRDEDNSRFSRFCEKRLNMHSWRWITFLENWTTVASYCRSCYNSVALRADVFETLVSWASRLRDFHREVSSLATISSNFSSVSTVRFLSGILSSSDSVVFTALTKLRMLCFLGSRCLGNWHRNFLRHSPADAHLKHGSTKSKRCLTMHLTPGMVLHHWMAEKCMTSNKSDNSQRMSIIIDSWCHTLAPKHCHRFSMAA